MATISANMCAFPSLSNPAYKIWESHLWNNCYNILMCAFPSSTNPAHKIWESRLRINCLGLYLLKMIVMAATHCINFESVINILSNMA